jgi:hypothetical protein
MTSDPLSRLLVPCAIVMLLACVAACGDKSDQASSAAVSGTGGPGPGQSTSGDGAAAAGATSTTTTPGSTGGGIKPVAAGTSAAETSTAGTSAMTGTGGNAAGTPTAGAGATKPPKTPPPPGSVSKPGEYTGYGEKVYDGYALSSQYVPMRDGVKLAVDLCRPSSVSRIRPRRG